MCVLPNDPTLLRPGKHRQVTTTAIIVTILAICSAPGCSTNTDTIPTSTNNDDEEQIVNASSPQTEPESLQTESSQDRVELSSLDGDDGRELLLRNFRPKSQLKVSATPLTHAKVPVVDIHTHFRNRTRHDPQFLDDFVELMDRNQIAVCVSMDGQLGDMLDEHIDYLWTEHRERFVIFANIDWIGDGQREDPKTWACQREGFVRRMVEQLKAAKEAGVSGLKVYKSFGLVNRDAQGQLLRIDDERWDPIWKTCGELDLPVLIHTADPAAFFLPIDHTNERWEELSRHPDWSFYGEEYPSREALLDARNRVIERHPNTKFIGAHVANNVEDLETVGEWLDRYPNLFVEFASRIGELGRQPYTSRRFLLKYQDRVLFGTDGPWPEQRILLYWRFLETYDEYFPYSEKEFPPQGLWQIYGVGLPDETLRAIYQENAARIIPGVRERIEKLQQSNGDD